MSINKKRLRTGARTDSVLKNNTIASSGFSPKDPDTNHPFSYQNFTSAHNNGLLKDLPFSTMKVYKDKHATGLNSPMGVRRDPYQSTYSNSFNNSSF